MLFHYSASDYREASSVAARHARDKLEALISRGRQRAANVIDLIESEVPDDFVVPGQKLEFSTGGDGLIVGFESSDQEVRKRVHRHALHQASDKARLPRRYADQLSTGETWQNELLAHNLNETFGHSEGSFLIRSVDDHVRGFLSNRFRRMDSRPIVEAFARTCQELGAVPVEGYHLQTRIALKALLPTVFEPVENEVLAIGVVLQNSDYGHGALSLRSFVLRLWCTNFAIADEMLRQVHLGRRLSENIEFSEQTHQLDTETMVSATRDIVSGAFAESTVKSILDGIRKANCIASAES